MFSIDIDKPSKIIEDQLYEKYHTSMDTYNKESEKLISMLQVSNPEIITVSSTLNFIERWRSHLEIDNWRF